MLKLPPNSKPGRNTIKSLREYIFNTITSVPSSEILPKLADESPSSQGHDVFASMRTSGSSNEI